MPLKTLRAFLGPNSKSLDSQSPRPPSIKPGRSTSTLKLRAVCIYIYIYIYLYIYIYIYIHIDVHIRTPTYRHVHMYTYTYVHLWKLPGCPATAADVLYSCTTHIGPLEHMHTYTYVHVCMYVCMYACMHACTKADTKASNRKEAWDVQTVCLQLGQESLQLYLKHKDFRLSRKDVQGVDNFISLVCRRVAGWILTLILT